jgi:hypothetical protein
MAVVDLWKGSGRVWKRCPQGKKRGSFFQRGTWPLMPPGSACERKEIDNDRYMTEVRYFKTSYFGKKILFFSTVARVVAMRLIYLF